MKKLIGIVSILAIIVISTILIMAIWGYPISWLLVWKSIATFVIASGASLFIYLFYNYCLKHNEPRNKFGKTPQTQS